ncbi:hypothetical protein [Sulfitobacter pacificus]|uniref:Uncharacterized protein n=1 Tax=Sulfitobacter pacificus TaxID=1499314 RepID=A0ABQ5VG30_9RHOB|nr:hypothetical protein [Sulfitobacter pacificus]GLQ26031.1 hypothetical protein GCM10007927_08340 [Sulfitobacter pacificus]
MLEIFFAMVAATLNGTPSAQTSAQAAGVQVDTNSVVIGQGMVIEGTPVPATPNAAADTSQQQFNMTVVPAGLTPEAQTPSGKFTTAAEVKPILNATKGNWVAVREYDGQDLLYVTHLWAWRCGLKAMAISVNGETMQNWPLPPCHTEFSTPNAVLAEDGAPYLTLRLGSVQDITIQIVYDDLSMDVARFARGDVLTP